MCDKSEYFSNVSFEVSIFEIALSMLAVASLILFSTQSLVVYSETSLILLSISLISLRWWIER